MATQTIKQNSGGYSDLDLTFNPHPVTGDLMVTTGEMAVVKSLKNLILYNHYEKPFNSSFGSNVQQLLFELITPFTAVAIEKEIEYTIRNYEPRINIDQIKVLPNYDENCYNVSIRFFIENLTDPFTADFILTRLR